MIMNYKEVRFAICRERAMLGWLSSGEKYLKCVAFSKLTSTESGNTVTN